ncbi:seven-hairpin glycosidase [Pluteus cervinus]|uniref:Seven-hairpin glycosidase n=1 Tax=Pluteus cervinus TaxID=181527 RepID=A0ACD3BBD3_9AGAR|nr:seven-hairpin glycosidase [Pluteus cervinus]
MIWWLGPLVFEEGRWDAFKSPIEKLFDSNKPVASTVWDDRAEQVKQAFVYAYDSYEKHAFPSDELLPLTGGYVNNFNGWGLTVFDALDTMWIMGLHDQFKRGVVLIANTTFPCKPTAFVPFFETVIRYLGGVLSGYALSGETILLARADELGMKLLPAFNTTSGFPRYAVNTETGETKMGWSWYALWAELLSNQVEYKYLAHLTGRPEYYNKTERPMQTMYEFNFNPNNTNQDLFSTNWDIDTGRPAGTHFAVGAFADSAHEYLLKQWLLTGRSEPKALELYLSSVNGILNNLLYLTPTRQLLYATDIQFDKASHMFEHLSCFLPGLLALGVHTLSSSTSATEHVLFTERDKKMHMWAAEGLAHTCWTTYADQESGLGPDIIDVMDYTEFENGTRTGTELEGARFDVKSGVPPGVPGYNGTEVQPERDPAKRDYRVRTPAYLLRPETVETFYIMWKTTGDVKWRERGWTIFQAIEEHARTPYGYASIRDVSKVPVSQKDEMPSFFLAETLKYLYLLFSEEDLIPLDKWVLNTEAHPLPVFQWRAEEKQRYGIPL